MMFVFRHVQYVQCINFFRVPLSRLSQGHFMTCDHFLFFMKTKLCNYMVKKVTYHAPIDLILMLILLDANVRILL